MFYLMSGHQTVIGKYMYKVSQVEIAMQLSLVVNLGNIYFITREGSKQPQKNRIWVEYEQNRTTAMKTISCQQASPYGANGHDFAQ